MLAGLRCRSCPISFVRIVVRLGRSLEVFVLDIGMLLILLGIGVDNVIDGFVYV